MTTTITLDALQAESVYRQLMVGRLLPAAERVATEAEGRNVEGAFAACDRLLEERALIGQLRGDAPLAVTAEAGLLRDAAVDAIETLTNAIAGDGRALSQEPEQLEVADRIEANVVQVRALLELVGRLEGEEG